MNAGNGLVVRIDVFSVYTGIIYLSTIKKRSKSQLLTKEDMFLYNLASVTQDMTNDFSKSWLRTTYTGRRGDALRVQADMHKKEL